MVTPLQNRNAIVAGGTKVVRDSAPPRVAAAGMDVLVTAHTAADLEPACADGGCIISVAAEVSTASLQAGSSSVTGRLHPGFPHVIGVSAQPADGGLVVQTRVLSACLTTPDRHAQEALALGCDDVVVEVRRLHLVDGSPTSLEHAQFRAASVPLLLEQALGGSIYHIVESLYGITPAAVDERIQAVNATPCESMHLAMAPMAAVLLISRTVRDNAGAPWEFSQNLFRTDYAYVYIHGSRPVLTANSANPDVATCRLTGSRGLTKRT